MKIFKILTITALTLCFSLLSICAFADDMPADKGAINAFFDKMVALEVLDKTDATDTDQMLRGDFLRLAMKIADVQLPVLKDDGDCFDDLESTSINRKYINAASYLGYISGEGGSFYPNKAISKAEAAKILMEILGYHTIAEEMGGFPAGYLVCAGDSGILSELKVEKDTALTLNEGVDLLDAFLEAKLPMKDFSGEKVKVYISDETLADHLGIGEVEGIVSEAGATGLYSQNPRSDMKVCIGNLYMNIREGLLCDDYLGLNCTGYYRIDKTTDEKILRYIEETAGKNNVLQKDSSDITYKDGYYCYEDKNQVRTAKLSTTYSLIYNGQFAVPNEDLMNTDNGFIRLVDNNDDNYYDVVFVYKFITYVLDDVNLTEKRLVTKSGRVFDVEADSDKYITIYLDGVREDIDVFTAPLVFSYAESLKPDRKVKTFYVSSKTVVGKASSKSAARGEITIGDENYKLRKSIYNSVPLSVSCTFYVDSFGYVAYFETDKDSYEVGYLYKCKIIENDDCEERGAIRVFGTDGVFREYNFAEKVRYNGAAKDFGTKVISDWQTLEDYKQLIRFKFNEDGEISAIDTAQNKPVFTEAGEEARANNVFRISSAGNVKYRSANYSFDLYVTLDANTKVFFIPTTDNEDDFRLLDRSKLANDSTYNYIAYNADEFGTAEYVVCSINYYGNTHAFHIVENSGSVLDADGDENQMVECWSGSTLTTFIATENSNYDSANMKQGDVIRVATNSAGEVTTFTVLHRYQEGIYPDFAYNTNRYSNNLFGATVKKIDRAAGTLVVECQGSHYIFKLLSNAAVVYDHGLCTTISISELCIGDHVVLKTTGADINNITVIR